MVNPESPSEVLEIVTLRSIEWIEETGCAVGAVIPFELEEMGVSGFAQIQSVGPCPEIASGEGRVVLSTITHVNSDVRVIRLENENIPLELTGSHRLFSVDRGEWIATRDLKPGETLAAQRGEVVIESVERKLGAHQVFNIEVENEHCFYVGETRILSHNVNPCANQKKTVSNPVDLTENRRSHILDGDNKGGGHRHGTGKPDKSEFPADWSDDKIIHEISDVATDPSSSVSKGKWGEDIFSGTRDGVDIEVVTYPSNSKNVGKISTGYPTNTPRNPR